MNAWLVAEREIYSAESGVPRNWISDLINHEHDSDAAFWGLQLTAGGTASETSTPQMIVVFY